MKRIAFQSDLLPNRRLHWISSIHVNEGDLDLLNNLQWQMKSYYSNSDAYYEEISFGINAWHNSANLVYQDLLNTVVDKEAVLEVGCGQAGILSTGKLDQERYTGVDFSKKIIETNRSRFADANFLQIEDPQRILFNDESFQMVFSVFVIEHIVFPHQSLLEQVRVLQPGGIFSLVCPNFLGIGRMTSQRKGFSQGTGSQKLGKGALLDAIVSSFDARVRIPILSYFYRRLALASPQFFINLRPVCFTDSFIPDVDAVYLTFEPEMKKVLEAEIEWLPLEPTLIEYCQSNNLIYIKGVKK